MKLEFVRQILEKYSDAKFHENPFSGSRVVPCGQTDERTDMTKLTVFCRDFAVSYKLSQSAPWRRMGGSTGIAPVILIRSTRMEVNGQHHALVGLISEKETWRPLRRKLSEPQNQSWLFGEEKNLLPFRRFEPRAAQPIAQ
jgi:hypothetical protein